MAGYNQRIIRALEDQGAKVKKTKKGLMIYAPNGGMITTHNTPSDYRAKRNFMNDLSNNGLRHPDDDNERRGRGTAHFNEEGYPTYVTTGKVSAASKKIILSQLSEMGWPERVTVPELNGKLAPSVVAKTLYQIGFRYAEDKARGSRGRNKVWAAPADLLALRSSPTAVEGATGEAKPSTPEPEPITPPQREPEPEPSFTKDEIPSLGAVTEPKPEPAPEPKPEPAPTPVTLPLAKKRDFIDDQDSWTIDQDVMPRKVVEYLESIMDVGLEVEIRVWRQK